MRVSNGSAGVESQSPELAGRSTVHTVHNPRKDRVWLNLRRCQPTRER